MIPAYHFLHYVAGQVLVIVEGFRIMRLCCQGPGCCEEGDSLLNSRGREPLKLLALRFVDHEACATISLSKKEISKV